MKDSDTAAWHVDSSVVFMSRTNRNAALDGRSYASRCGSDANAAIDCHRWTSHEFVVVQAEAESLGDALDVSAGEKVLEVVAGDGPFSLVGARRGCIVACCSTADALPFVDGTFDVVLSPFGVMSVPWHETKVRELLRVCRSTGRLGLAMWTPDGFMGRLSTLTGSYAPRTMAMPAAQPDLEDCLEHWFRRSAFNLHTSYRDVVFRHRSAELWMDMLQTCYGPVRDVFARLPRETRRPLEQEMLDLIDEFNIAIPPAVVVRSQYVEVLVAKH